MAVNIFKILSKLKRYIVVTRDRKKLVWLMKNGLKVGINTYIGPNVIFDQGYPYLIEIGENCRISSGTTILVHDATAFKEIGLTRLAKVRILKDTFIGINTIILPGVTIGPNAVIAAGSVVNRDIGEGKIAAGNPARPYGEFSDLLKTYRKNAKSAVVFDVNDIETNKVKVKDIMNSIDKHNLAFVSGIPESDSYYVNANMRDIRAKAKKNLS